MGRDGAETALWVNAVSQSHFGIVGIILGELFYFDLHLVLLFLLLFKTASILWPEKFEFYVF